MSARISIDLDDTPDATIEVAQGTHRPDSVWVKLRDGQTHALWLTTAQALSLYHGLGDVLMVLNIATIEAAGLETPERIPVTDEPTRSFDEALAIVRNVNGVTVPGSTFPAMNQSASS